MRQIGQVTETSNAFAVVALKKHAACGDCGACQLGEENMDTTVRVSNPIQAEVGDFVAFEMPDQQVLKAAFLVYLVPLAALVLGILVGQHLLSLLNITQQVIIDFGGLIVGLVAMTGAYFMIRNMDTKLKSNQDYTASITEIIGDI